MKVLVAVTAAVLVLVPAAFATGQALDPRVPGLQRQVRALQNRVNVADASIANLSEAKLDKSCVDLIPLVLRPGYVAQDRNGNLFVTTAVDTYRPDWGDTSFNRLMQLRQGC